MNGKLIVILAAVSLVAAGVSVYLCISDDEDILYFDSDPEDDSIVSTAASYRFVFTGENTENVRWLFGDGTESADASPVHEYGEGTYLVRCEAYNDGFQSSKSVLLTVESNENDDTMWVLALFSLSALCMIVAILGAGERRW